MKKYLIKAIQNFDDVYRYIIKKDSDIHGAFCGLLVDLGIDKEDILGQIDIIFDNLDNEFIYLTNNESDMYLFITKDYVNLVIKTQMEQRELNKKMEQYFSFPYEVQK